MKLFIEVEISAEEIPLATELFRTLRTLTDHVKTRDVGKLFQALIARLENGNELDSVAEEISVLLADGGGTAYRDFWDAFVSVVFNKDLVIRQQSVVPFMFLLPRLPEPGKTQIRDFLIPKVLKHLTIKRPIETNRMDFFAHAESFAALVNMGFLNVTGAVRSITNLLQKPENRSAAVTMLGKTVELCLQQLTEECEPQKLQDLAAALSNVTDEVFQYDINYIEESMGWTRVQPQVAPLDQGGGGTSVGMVGAVGPVGPVQAPIAAENSGMADGGGTYGLRPVTSFFGHQSTIFAICYDETRQQLVSGGKDGVSITWSPEGQVVQTWDMTRHYACSMDIHQSHRTLLVCGVQKEDVTTQAGGMVSPPPPPCLVAYSHAERGWQEHGRLSKESSKLVSCIKAMGHGAEHGCVTGETRHGEGGSQQLDERVCYYDIQAASSFSKMEPIHQYTDHQDLITCVSLIPPNPNIFMSGSRDFTVRIWDRRRDGCVGMFGTMSQNGRIQAHEQMITCLDASDVSMVLSAGIDFRVLMWDFRTLGQNGSPPVGTVQLDDSPFLKVALGGNPNCAAVSTLRGLYMVDFNNVMRRFGIAEPFADKRRVGRYHDLKWAHGRKLLYAAGDDMRVDVYSFLE
ncbi:hypothetical protein CBR_g8489 [Chara braunii]|uniref:Uncharacterized protein n=1 Tax=Chara braunii TaxID=69332 RepID=A0A388KMA1_CHABU|nr:hypothetical protein CBR_g8489 [Chara braunii]|eukprot:GBG71186.1 hypothetical protein CBR_g8489 [Chara braunii]